MGNNADWDCFKTLVLREILRIQNQLLQEHCVFGSHTFVPRSWMCKKQTSVSHSSTESEIISLDAGLRLDGIPALDLWDLIVSVLGNTIQTHDRPGQPVVNCDNLLSIIKSGLIPGGQNLSNRQTVFFTSVDPMDKEHKDPDTIDLNEPRHAQYMRPCKFGLHSKRVSNQQGYCGELRDMCDLLVLWKIQQKQKPQGNLTPKLSLHGPVTWKVKQRNAWKEIANWQTRRLNNKVGTPCIDDHHFKEEEFRSVGE